MSTEDLKQKSFKVTGERHRFFVSFCKLLIINKLHEGLDDS